MFDSGKKDEVVEDQLDQFDKTVKEANRKIDEYCDSMKAMMMNIMNILVEREALRYQE